MVDCEQYSHDSRCHLSLHKPFVTMPGKGNKKVYLRTSSISSSYSATDTPMTKSTDVKQKLTPKVKSPGKQRKKKMAWPRRILRILESGKRVHFQNVSLSKKRQMCINHYLPVSDKGAPSGRNDLHKSYAMSCPQSSSVDKSGMTIHAKVPSSEHCSLGISTPNPATENICEPQNDKSKAAVPERGHNPCKEVVAIDCEMVGLGPKGCFSALARCSIVDHSGNIVYDSYIRPDEPITDYRTKWSGIRPRNMVNAISFREAQEKVKNILKDKIVVGHAVWNDFRVLRFSHPMNDIRDTSRCKILADIYGSKCQPGQHLGLKSLAKYLLGIDVQKGEHSSVEDARAAMDLYKLVEEKWEEELQSSFPDQDFRTSFLDDHFWPEDLV